MLDDLIGAAAFNLGLRAQPRIRSDLAAATAATTEKWTEMAKHCGEQAALKKEFDAAKDSHDLMQQKEILAKAKKVQEKIEEANKTGYAKFEEAGGADIRAFIVDGEIVGAMKRQGKEGDFRSNLHRGANASIIKLSKAEKLGVKIIDEATMLIMLKQ